MQIAICCDFDGTITLMDTGKALLSTLTDKDWQAIDKFVIRGEMGTREALIQQWGMIEKTTMDEINAIVDEIQIDDSFKEFFNWVNGNKFKFLILSDGFITYIKRILDNYKIPVSKFEIKANDMVLENNKLKLHFLTPECTHGCANCKYSFVKRLKDDGYKIIYIGDGLSDILPARSLADIIFAKKDEDLARELDSDKRLYIFSDFSDILKKIQKLSL